MISPLRVAMVGTRGVPAHYGGFETAIEEIGQRLVLRGHQVTVYCRSRADEEPVDNYLGMRLVHLPALRSKSLETLGHTALSTAHMTFSRRHDAAVVFNAANAPFVPALQARGVPTAVHVDGLEWKRAKWGGFGRHYYRVAEALAVRWADALIADAQGIADYYTREFGAPTQLLAYGAPIQADPAADRLPELGLQPGGYHLVVARFEPENHVEEVVVGYHRSDACLPLVVVGSAPYAGEYTARIHTTAAADDRIRLLGGVWDQQLLDQLYANSLTYLHGHSVGGTNPSLLRAMGAGAAVLAYDVDFNREVLGMDGEFFTDPNDVSKLVMAAEQRPEDYCQTGIRLRERAKLHYRWDDVTVGYESLLRRLANGYSIRGMASGRRTDGGIHLLRRQQAPVLTEAEAYR